MLGKAATLNADVGDVLISSVVHDEHSRSTYWLDNVFSVDDLAGDLRFGTGLDNQRAVTVKSTFLQNRAYLDFYYREAFTVVEMEAGPFCNAVYEIADADRFPVGEAVNFAKLPIDLGIIHYASDTPYTQARTLGARGLSYYGMDSTYASSLAILRRILRLEGILPERRRRVHPHAPRIRDRDGRLRGGRAAGRGRLRQTHRIRTRSGTSPSSPAGSTCRRSARSDSARFWSLRVCRRPRRRCCTGAWRRSVPARSRSPATGS